LWTDDPETLNSRLSVYATLWHAMKTVTLLFNPVTPYLSEALYQGVYRKLDPTLAESVNFEAWPEPNEKLRDTRLEENFLAMFKCVSLVYAARQKGKLKRRWPLKRLVVVAEKEVCEKLKELNALFLELANVKTAEFLEKAPAYTSAEEWVSAVEGNIQVFLDTRRDEHLMGEGLMRDLARRVQALRKELGYVPTDVLSTVFVAELDEESMKLLTPFVDELKELIRSKAIYLQAKREDGKEWHECQMDDKLLYVAVSR
ncbi:MAG: DUF5915 domain-containing protein, partial [Candidatus Bathyarchaeia archaeon]